MRTTPFMQLEEIAIAICLGYGLCTTAVSAQTPLTWADFGIASRTKQDAPLRTIVLSERPGDVALNAMEMKDGAAQISGRLSTQNGSAWATLGMEFGRPTELASTSMDAYGAMRIRLAALSPGIVRIRLKGTDLKLQRSGCYPVMMQQVGTSPTDYLIPLAAFEAERYCGNDGATPETTLPDLFSVEVTANDPSEEPIRFSVGKIEFLRTSMTAPLNAPHVLRGSDWKLAWAEDFDMAANRGLDPTRWQIQRISPTGAETRTASAKDLGNDGQGRLSLRLSESTSALRILSKPAGVMLYGRLEVRFKLPSTSGVRSRLTLQGAPLTDLSWPDAGEIVLAEISGGTPRMTVGLIGPQLTDGSELSTLPSYDGFSKKFHTIALEWEPGHVRWILDDVVVKDVRKAQLPLAAQQTFDQWPYLLQIGVDATIRDAATLMEANKAPDGDALQLDYVHLYKRSDLTTIAAERLAVWAAQYGNMGNSDRARPISKPQGKPANVTPAQAANAQSMHQVVCNRDNKLGLMLCH